MEVQVIHHKSGIRMQNLWGVFRRRFPIAFGDAERTGTVQYIGYNGDEYRIEPKPEGGES